MTDLHTIDPLTLAIDPCGQSPAAPDRPRPRSRRTTARACPRTFLVATLTTLAACLSVQARAQTQPFPQGPAPSGPYAYPAAPYYPFPAQPKTITRLPYEDGQAVPNGWRVEERSNRRLTIAGVATGGALWGVSMLAAIMLDAQEDVVVIDSHGGVRDDPEFDDDYTPLFIPVVGPFVTIGTADASGTGAAILVVDGVAQTASVVMAIVGGVTGSKELVKLPTGLEFAPAFGNGQAGVQLSGRF